VDRFYNIPDLYLSIKEGGLPETLGNKSDYGQAVGLTASRDGYCYVRVTAFYVLTGEGTFSLKTLIQDTSLELQLNQAQTITVNYDRPLWYQLNIPPHTDSLFLTLQKMENTWDSALMLKQLEGKVASRNGYGDLVSQVKNPPPGIYDVEVTSSKSGKGVLTASTEELTLGAWKVRRIYRSYGHDWCQVMVPAGQPSLFIEVEILGLYSQLDVWRDEIGSQEHWRSKAKRIGEKNVIELLIPNPVEGIYYLQVMDSATVVGADSQERDYMIRADTSRLLPIPIDNEFVKLEILPNRAAVSSLIFRQGSNQELIQSRYERYLVDLGSEDKRLAAFLKDNWKLNSYDIHDTYAAFDFSHPTGFRKHLLTSWNEQHVEIRCDLTAPESVVINNNLAPGGTTGGGGDHWAAPHNLDVLTGDFAYPSSYRQVYPATSGEWAMPPGGWISFWDDKVDEVYGFTFSSGYGVQIGEDGTTHFKFRIPAGSSTIAFQVRKPRLDKAYTAIRALGEKPIFTLTVQVDQRFTGANALLTYIIEYANTGPGEATQTTIQDLLPPELTYIDGSATGGGTYNPSTHSLNWNIGALDANGSAQQVSFQAQVDSSVTDGHNIVNTARIFCNEVRTPIENNTITTVATPTITSVSPKEGGNTGTVTITITGRNLDPAAEVTMVRLDKEAIRRTNVSGYSDGTKLVAEFDIRDKTEGFWDIIVKNPNGLISTSEPESANDFEIVPGESPCLWIEILGREEIRIGRPTTYIIQYGNCGNVDALGVPLWIAFPKMATWELDTEIIPPPPIEGVPPIDWKEIPVCESIWSWDSHGVR
jgi:uncharacterized repeat protein (TIGR01451 family)